MASIHLFPSPEPKRRLDQFPLVKARCPNDFSKTIMLAVSDDTVQRIIKAGRRTELCAGWAHIVGQMPPVNNAELIRRTDYSDVVIRSLSDADACFAGVQRRYDQENDGRSVYVYSIRSPHTVRWAPTMRSVIDVFPSVQGTVITVQVRSVDSLQCETAGVWGTITKWEVVNADRERPELPEGYAERYDSLLWSL